MLPSITQLSARTHLRIEPFLNHAPYSVRSHMRNNLQQTHSTAYINEWHGHGIRGGQGGERGLTVEGSVARFGSKSCPHVAAEVNRCGASETDDKGGNPRTSR